MSIRPSWLVRHRWSAALVGSVAILALGLLGSSLGLIVAPTAPTMAVVVPTPTAILTPTPSPKPGFTYYTEAVSNFQMQYPIGWVAVPQNPGVEIDDNAPSPTYIMQVLMPTANLDLQTDWVQYEFNNLRQTSGTSNFQQVGSLSQMVVGGELWSSKLATLQQGTNTITVRVLATVHHDRAYIINLLAANVDMTTAQTRYFNDILNTFAFLT